MLYILFYIDQLTTVVSRVLKNKFLKQGTHLRLSLRVVVIVKPN